MQNMQKTFIKILYFLSGITAIVLLVTVYYKKSKGNEMKPGTIIFLNGASSSGKSSIAKELQNIFDEPYLHIGIDGWLHTMPQRFWGPNQPHANKGFQWGETQDDRGPLVTISVGPWGEKLIAGMYHAIAGLASQGNNVINDDVILSTKTLAQAIKALRSFRVYFIGVKCPLSVLEEREKARGERVLNMVRGQHKIIHQHGTYDFEVDTSTMSPPQCAETIKAFIDSHDTPHAFTTLEKTIPQSS